MTRFLVRAGAPIDQRDRDGRTPIDYAVHFHHRVIQTILFDAGGMPSPSYERKLSQRNHMFARFGWIKIPPQIKSRFTFVCDRGKKTNRLFVD